MSLLPAIEQAEFSNPDCCISPTAQQNGHLLLLEGMSCDEQRRVMGK